MKLYIDTYNDKKFGKLVVAVTEKGLRLFSHNERTALKRFIRHAEKYNLTPVKGSYKTRDIMKQLVEYFHNKRKSFSVKLDIGYFSLFTRRVLRAAFRVPYGKVATYGQLARKAGSPGASRAVGQVMAKNPVPIVIPCHRVIGSDGSLTGFGGGLGLKKRLLEKEGVVVRKGKVVKY
jgi:methylated-DNA-[protein]-cysteine S-methyltransferase